MDELLRALQHEDARAFEVIAATLFFTRDGRYNTAQINEFTRYAPCRLVSLDTNSFGTKIGRISYNSRLYSFYNKQVEGENE